MAIGIKERTCLMFEKNLLLGYCPVLSREWLDVLSNCAREALCQVCVGRTGAFP